jgi:peroxiredoxin
MKIKNLLYTCALMLPFAMTAAPADSAKTIAPIQVGQTAPDVTLKTSAGESFDMGAAVRSQPTVVIFYRGGWCPYCNLHLSELQGIEKELKEWGYQILAVSPDGPSALQPTMDKHELNYTLLSDREMAASSAYGVAFRLTEKMTKKYKKFGLDLASVPGDPESRWLPVPAVFVIGADGIVRFVHSDPNYKVRIDTVELLETAIDVANSSD